MFCPKCGNEMANAGQFCGKCGTPLAVHQQTPSSQPVAYQTPAAQPIGPQHAETSAAQAAIQQAQPAGLPAYQGTSSGLPAFDNSTQEFVVQTGLLPWFKESISVSPTMLKGSYPSSILSVIPFGINQVGVPIDHISNVGMHTSLNMKKLIFGIIGALVGLAMLGQGDLWPALGIVLILWGINSCINSYLCAIRYEKSGTTEYLFAIFFEKKKLQQIAEILSHQVEMNNRKVVTYQQTATMVGAQQASTNAIVDAIGAMA